MSEQDSQGISEDAPSGGWYSDAAATFGDRVAAAREVLGLGQVELARRLGVKLKTVKAWEDDISDPRANKLQMLSGVLNVSLMWLLNGEGDGVAEPDENTESPGDVAELLTEIRQIRGTIAQAADHLGEVEKRLRRALRDRQG